MNHRRMDSSFRYGAMQGKYIHKFEHDDLTWLLPLFGNCFSAVHGEPFLLEDIFLFLFIYSFYFPGVWLVGLLGGFK